jgi:hypothetical protein
MPEDLLKAGVKTAALLREIREFGDQSLNYFFEMAWFSIYQACDEQTRAKLLQAVEADLARELRG